MPLHQDNHVRPFGTTIVNDDTSSECGDPVNPDHTDQAAPDKKTWHPATLFDYHALLE